MSNDPRPSWEDVKRLAIEYIMAEELDLTAAVADFSAQFDRLRADAPPSFDFRAHLQHQREWSGRTFGPGSRAKGVVDHIRKELREIEADPGDLKEWIDVTILALDGAWRSGASPDQIIAALVAKQSRNEQRAWPDWRTLPDDVAIEHVRADAPPREVEQKSTKPSDVLGWMDSEGPLTRAPGAPREEIEKACAAERDNLLLEMELDPNHPATKPYRDEIDRLEAARAVDQQEIQRLREHLSNVCSDLRLAQGYHRATDKARLAAEALLVQRDAEIAAWEMRARRTLWLNHGCERRYVYGDDGEMQCNNGTAHPGVWDFKRTSWDEIEQAFVAALAMRLSAERGALDA
jgi:hypothetical protein